MLKIVYTCPKCGSDLVDMMLADNLSQNKKFCQKCGWSAQESDKEEKVIRVPYEDRENISVTSWTKIETPCINTVNSLTPTYKVTGKYVTVTGVTYKNDVSDGDIEK